MYFPILEKTNIGKCIEILGSIEIRNRLPVIKRIHEDGKEYIKIVVDTNKGVITTDQYYESHELIDALWELIKLIL